MLEMEKEEVEWGVVLHKSKFYMSFNIHNIQHIYIKSIYMKAGSDRTDDLPD